MTIFEYINNKGYEILFVALASVIFVQILKVVLHSIRTKKFNLFFLFSTGGMPSSHSAMVSAAAISTGLVKGFDSTFFALATIMAFIVMQDATGVRQSASEQARVLNQIAHELFSPGHHLNRERLKEFLGHTPKQVFIGSLIGIVISLISHWLI
ncbi:MAG: divergent PAP2 family protein [Candidatus Marinimicrobia bacterium]|nr:divergent PAP2 family protein [Candidatus Neomarinimicrobiota bacterium]